MRALFIGFRLGLTIMVIIDLCINVNVKISINRMMLILITGFIIVTITRHPVNSADFSGKVLGCVLLAIGNSNWVDRWVVNPPRMDNLIPRENCLDFL